MNVYSDFGDGALGDVTISSSTNINLYASVVEVNGKTITIKNQTGTIKEITFLLTRQPELRS